MLAEEMRLYVAPGPRAYLFSWDGGKSWYAIRSRMEIYFQDQALIDASLRNVTNYLDLIIMALMRHPIVSDLYGPETIEMNAVLFPHYPDLSFEVISHLSLKPEVPEQEPLGFEEGGDVEAIKKRLNFVYPYQAKTTHFAKMSISDLKRLDRLV